MEASPVRRRKRRFGQVIAAMCLWGLAVAAPAAAAPPPTAMPGDALVAAWPDRTPTFSMGRFSPDGMQLALVVGQLADASDQAWLYDLRTRRLSALTEAPKAQGLYIEIKDLVWGADGALYIWGDKDQQDGSGVQNFQLAETAGQVSPATPLPKAVAAAFAYDARPDLGEGPVFQRTYENAEYVVTVRDVRHPFYRLTARRKGAKRVMLIANGGGALPGFSFDRPRSLVRYVDDTAQTIVTYDLKTGKAQTLLSIGSAEANLLDTSADGTLLAFERYGSCDAASTPADNQRYQVCLVRLQP
jgi:hypothetical protein